MTVVFMDTDDVYQLLLKFDVPGVRKDAGRLWKGVQTGDAGVIGELVQAGEAVQQQRCLWSSAPLLTRPCSSPSQTRRCLCISRA